MLDEYKAKLAEAQKTKKSIKKKIAKLKKLRKGAVDSLVHPLHDKAFENIQVSPVIYDMNVKIEGGQGNIQNPYQKRKSKPYPQILSY